MNSRRLIYSPGTQLILVDQTTRNAIQPVQFFRGSAPFALIASFVGGRLAYGTTWMRSPPVTMRRRRWQMVDTCSNSFPDDGQFAHSGHAQIARRVNLSHASG